MRKTVEFSCGHSAEVSLPDDEAQQIKRIKYFKEQGLCPECYKKQKREDPEISVVICKMPGESSISVFGYSVSIKQELKGLGYKWVSETPPAGGREIEFWKKVVAPGELSAAEREISQVKFDGKMKFRRINPPVELLYPYKKLNPDFTCEEGLTPFWNGKVYGSSIYIDHVGLKIAKEDLENFKVFHKYSKIPYEILKKYNGRIPEFLNHNNMVYISPGSYEKLIEWEGFRPKLKTLEGQYFESMMLTFKESAVSLLGYKHGDATDFVLFHSKRRILKAEVTNDNPGTIRYCLYDKNASFDEREKETLKSAVSAYFLANRYIYAVNIVEHPDLTLHSRNLDNKNKEIIIAVRTEETGTGEKHKSVQKSPKSEFAVRGHYRKYRNGKITFVHAYIKGKKKD